ncbi:MAG: hypothetical protein ACXV3F_07315 [Frankiaceae bacterium]
MRARSVRVLLSEGSSLTAREHVTVLGSAGVRVEVMSSDPFALCRWSRWVRRFYRCPPASVDPAVPYPYFLKAEYSTAGRGVRAVRTRRTALACFSGAHRRCSG